MTASGSTRGTTLPTKRPGRLAQAQGSTPSTSRRRAGKAQTLGWWLPMSLGISKPPWRHGGRSAVCLRQKARLRVQHSARFWAGKFHPIWRWPAGPTYTKQIRYTQLAAAGPSYRVGDPRRTCCRYGPLRERQTSPPLLRVISCFRTHQRSAGASTYKRPMTAVSDY